MPETIICPVCGESNPADMEFCRNCQSRLRPLPGTLGNEDAPIQPGELPTKKVTSELEPLLPQWLRDARKQARDSAAEDAMRTDQKAKEDVPAPSSSDLLAGLASQQAEDDDDIPDWLANITGATSKKKKPISDENQVKWVELGHEPPENPLDAGGAMQAREAETPASEKDELTDWFKQAAASSETADFRATAPPLEQQSPLVPADDKKLEPGRPSEDLSWLTNLDAAGSEHGGLPSETPPPAREQAPDWLKKLQAEQTPPTQAASTPAFQTDVPEWLRQFGEETPASPAMEQPAEEAAPPETMVPDWLRNLPTSDAPVERQPEARATPEEPIISTELPDWMASLGKQQGTSDASESAPANEIPDWMASLGNEPQAPETAESLFPTEAPDWLSSLRSEQQTAPAAESEPTGGLDAIPGELPDWVASLGGENEKAPEEPLPAPSAAEPSGAEPPTEHAAPEGAALASGAPAGEDVDAVFASMQTPDWLSAVLPKDVTPEENIPTAAQQPEEAIGPAELPSWVQAMRPVESAISAGTGAEEDIGTEKRGPLAGLHGVLPAVPGATEPSSKPKAHSIKLDATEQQLAHAALLEKILAAETAPIPMKSSGVLRSQRGVRWAISLLLLTALAAVVFGRTQMFQLPSGVPNETVAAINAVEAVPAEAPVLVVFDYQPSTVGEMEAAGGPLLDHLLLLNHPRLALLSTSPTGPALAERFMSTVLADRGYARDQQYIDLGYLPGGIAGVYSFGQSPSGAMSLDAQLKPIWQSPVLAPQGKPAVQNLSDFAAIIVLTDAVESGRTWIEQTSLARGQSPMIIVASAQAGPMLLPYVDSGQVKGMISGIYGAVGAEQQNAGSPGLVRRYWDAYSAGLYLAVAMIVLGALWNLWLGIRERRAQVVG